MDKSIETTVQTIIKSQIVTALNDGPEIVEKLVEAALGKEVDEYGAKPTYSSKTKQPYLDWVVGEQIRMAARKAVIEVVESRQPEIHAAVKKAVQAESLVDGLIAKILGSLDQSYKVEVNFADESD